MSGHTRAPLAILAILVALAMSACTNHTQVTNTDTPASASTDGDHLEPELHYDEFSVDDFKTESHDDHEEDAGDEYEEFENTPRNNDAPSPWAWLA